MSAVARAGKPCFTEKPLAPTFDVVRDIVQIVRDSGLPVQVGFQSRFHPLIRRLRTMVETAESGAPLADWRSCRRAFELAVRPGGSRWRRTARALDPLV